MKRTNVFILAILTGLVIVLAGCKQVGRFMMPDLVSADQEWIVRETRHFFIFYRPGSQAEYDIDSLAAGFDNDMKKVLAYLEVDYRNKISCYIYSSILDKQNNGLLGGTTCYSMPSQEMIVAVYNPPHEVYAVGAHEITHVVVYWTVGVNVSDMLAEGIAVAVENGYSMNITPHQAAAGFLKNGRLKPLETMFDNRAWVAVMDENSHLYYNQAGSFVRYLVDTYGPQPFKGFYPGAGQNTYRKAFSENYGRTISEAYADWLAFLSKM